MKIKSDETPKINKIQKFFKRHKTNEVLGVLTKGALILLSFVAIFWVLYTMLVSIDDATKAHEKEVAEIIIKYSPVIKRHTKYYLPDEYELTAVDGVYMLNVTPKGLSSDAFYLSQIKLILDKEVTDRFREAVYKSRGYVSNDMSTIIPENVSIQKIIEVAEKKKVEIKDLVPTQTNNIRDINITTESSTTIHTHGYYQRKAYVDGYNPLRKSYDALEAYKLTEEYKHLRRFEKTDKLRELNIEYNKNRSTMWKLHYELGMEEGSFDDLQQGKLRPDMVNGQLIFSFPFSSN